jgi:two-component SAPR family response regulator
MINCLGQFSLEINGRVVQRWRSGRSKNLFQYLLVNRNKLVLKESLHDVLWPDAEWSATSSSLKVAVHGLRQVLDAHKAIAPCDLEVVYQDFGYLLKTGDGVWIDFGEFEQLIAQAAAVESRNDLDRAAWAYEQAVTLYEGDFLIGETADWVGEQREWLRGSALRALNFLARYALRRGDEWRALGYCREGLKIDPCGEGFYRLTMLIHARRGELGQVERWYDLCVHRLRARLGVGPSPETTRLLGDAMAGVLRRGGKPVPLARVEESRSAVIGVSARAANQVR